MSKPIKVTDRNKPWNKRKVKRQPYQIEIQLPEKTFLIICEGVNTEPEYFKSFPVKTAVVESYGLGSTKTTLVNYAIKTIVEQNDPDTENWVVFDMDVQLGNEVAQREDYENAIQLAESKGIKAAYSNDAFELWFLLHYQYFDNEWTRHQYYQKLSELWDCNYEKLGKQLKFCKNIYQKLMDDPKADQKQAIERAKKLFLAQKERRIADKNPITLIHVLVESLNQHIEI